MTARPELAALSFLAHRRHPDRRLAAAVEAAVAKGLLGLAKRGHKKALEYLDVLHRWMKKSTRKTMETMWTDRGYIPVGPGKKLYNRGRRDGLDEGKVAGIAEGKAAGIAEGKVAGIAEGKVVGVAAGEALGKAEAILLVLRGRGVRVSAKARARIRAERNTATLDAWLLRAGVAQRESDVLGSDASANGKGNGSRR